MTHYSDNPGRPGIATVIGDTVRSFRDLVRTELDLFKAETVQSANMALSGLIAIVLGAVFAIVALTLVVEAIVEWLAVVLESEALAAAIVAIVTALIALVAFIYGARQISSVSVTPDRTIRSVKRDAAVVTEKVTS